MLLGMLAQPCRGIARWRLQCCQMWQWGGGAPVRQNIWLCCVQQTLFLGRLVFGISAVVCCMGSTFYGMRSASPAPA
jgi:hypothetical protein